MYSLLLESPAPRGPADFIVPKGANVEVIIALARARQFTLCVCVCVCVRLDVPLLQIILTQLQLHRG